MPVHDVQGHLALHFHIFSFFVAPRLHFCLSRLWRSLCFGEKKVIMFVVVASYSHLWGFYASYIIWRFFFILSFSLSLCILVKDISWFVFFTHSSYYLLPWSVSNLLKDTSVVYRSWCVIVKRLSDVQVQHSSSHFPSLLEVAICTSFHRIQARDKIVINSFSDLSPSQMFLSPIFCLLAFASPEFAV